MHPRESIDHLDLHQHVRFDHEIGAKGMLELDAFVDEADRLLPNDTQAATLAAPISFPGVVPIHQPGSAK